MALKENALWFGIGAVIALGLPTILTWVNIGATAPYNVAWDWSMARLPSFGPPAMAMEAELLSYKGSAGGGGGHAPSHPASPVAPVTIARGRGGLAPTSSGRTISTVTRGAGRHLAGDTVNTIGFGGDLAAVPAGTQGRLVNPALAERTQRFVRS